MEIATDSTHMLHQLRTMELQALEPPVSGDMVSVGCNGLQYFDWIETNLGHINTHIGLEYYLARPAALPANVKWVANTAGDMRDVVSRSVGLVFAGQTVEHLWWEELAGFFLEAARVVIEGGRLVYDSPNREISNLLCWNHPEHTVELTPDDGRHLAYLAGFDVTKVVGHWLCLDRTTGQLNRPGIAGDPNS